MTTEWKPKPGDRVRVVCGTAGKVTSIDGAEARYVGEVVGARTHPHCVTVDGDDGARTVAHSVEPVEPEWQVGVDAIRREVEALRTRVIGIELARSVAHVWSDGTVGPTRPITEDDIGKLLPSVRTASAEDLARELAAMTERAEVAEARYATLREAVCDALGEAE